MLLEKEENLIPGGDLNFVLNVDEKIGDLSIPIPLVKLLKSSLKATNYWISLPEMESTLGTTRW